MTTIEFYFDFASPNAYIAHHALKGVAKRTGAAIEYKPVLLGGIFKAANNLSPFMRFADVKGRFQYEQRDMHRFLEKYELSDFKMNTNFPVNTLQIMRGAIALKGTDTFMPYVEGMMAAMWEKSLKMDDPAVVEEQLIEAGLSHLNLGEKIQEAEVKTTLIENTNAAVERGLFGIPTFFVGNEMFFGKDRLQMMEEHIVATSHD